MAARPNLHKQTFTKGLAQAIRLRKPVWAAKGSDVVQEERPGALYGTSGRPDILIDDPLSPPLVIEVSYGARDAEKNARKRIGRSLSRRGATIHAAIALRIPASFGNLRGVAEVTDRLVDGDRLEYAFLQGETGPSATRWPAAGFIKGRIDDLVSILPAIRQTCDTIDTLASYVANQVRACAQLVQARISAAKQASVACGVGQRMHWQGLTTASVFWLDALLSQHRLGNALGSRLPTLPECKDETGKPLPYAVADTWRAALEINFRAIFGPALGSLLEVCDASPHAASEGLACLLKAAERIEIAGTGPYTDVGAELFPRLSEDCKTSAAFYTKPTAAELLACLTIREHVEGGVAIPWGNRRLGRMMRIADTSCGTGTLLRAGYRQIRGFHEKHGGDPAALHKDFMEHGIVAMDVSAIAAHLTATSLAAMEPGVPYGAAQIGCVPVGGLDRTGSLELLQYDEVGNLLQHSSETRGGKARSDQSTSAFLPALDLDFFLANPPNSHGRGRQSLFDVSGLPNEERVASQRRAGVLGRETCASLRAGLATYFLAIADRKLRVGGTMGFVLPLTAASAHSYKPVRTMIEQRYRNVIAVTIVGGAPGERSFSSGSGTAEMLLVATKAPPSEDRSVPVVCVTLYEGLTGIGQARETARATLESIRDHSEAESGEILAGSQRLGSWVRRRRAGSGEPWSELGSLHVDLAIAAEQLLVGKLTNLRRHRTMPLPVPMVELGDLFRVGPTHHRIGHLVGNQAIGAFEFHARGPDFRVGQELALWHADSKEQRQLRVSPTHYGIDPPDPDRGLQSRMRNESSTMFYARNLRWTSQALLVATTEQAAMGGSAWTALGHEDERVCKAFTLWANSTLGLIVQWTQGSKQQPGRSRVQVNAIKKIPVPDLGKLAAEGLESAVRAFDALCDRELRPACQAHADESREAIDRAVLGMFGFLKPLAWQAVPGDSEGLTGIAQSIVDLRNEFSAEPQVHGHNRQALSLLEARRKSRQVSPTQRHPNVV